nr:hypothetical protein [Ectobacillus panaciterrae]
MYNPYGYYRQTFPPYPPGGQVGGYPPYPPGGQVGGYPPYPPGGQVGGYLPYPPGGQVGGYPPYQPGGQVEGPSQGPPQGPPPSYTPQKPQVGLYAVDPGGIRRCLYRYTYIWLRNGRHFWFYPVFVGRDSVAGYRWSPSRYRWVYTGFDLNTIDYFQCS